MFAHIGKVLSVFSIFNLKKFLALGSATYSEMNAR
jgi:hypothetical protein